MQLTPLPVEDALNGFLRREVPGCEWRVDTGNDYVVKVAVRGPRPGVTGNIDELIALDDRALASMATEMVRALRARAIEAYGLAAELTAAKDTARQAGRDEVVAELDAMIDELRDENGQLPDRLLPAADWVRVVTRRLPRVDIRPATDARDLEAVEQHARRYGR